ncbi:MAG: hypothetical protein M0Z55_06875 [Peptococcaceae bacterium]|nr:hypothetical protein [Peptococcaceae bacterium]
MSKEKGKKKSKHLSFLLIVLLVVGGSTAIFTDLNRRADYASPGSAVQANTEGDQNEVSPSVKVGNTTPADNERLVGLNGQSTGNDDVLTKFVPVVRAGIDYAEQQGSLYATQDIKHDGALTVDSNNNLTLLIFLKNNSLINFTQGADFIQGDSNVGFLWSCIMEKMQAAMTTDQSLQTEHNKALINSFNITYFNTSGDKLSIAMPQDTPIDTFNGQLVQNTDDMREKIQQFFANEF